MSQQPPFDPLNQDKEYGLKNEYCDWGSGVTLDHASLYGLSIEEMVSIPISGYRSNQSELFHFGGYLGGRKFEPSAPLSRPLWSKSSLEAAQKSKADSFSSLVAQHGEAGAKRLREEEDLAASKRRAVERAAAADDALVLKLAKRALAIRAKWGKAEPLPPMLFKLESPVVKSQVKEHFGLTETQFKHVADRGPFGRSKSSYKASDLAAVAASLDHYTPLEALRLTLVFWEDANPTLVERGRKRAQSVLEEVARKKAMETQAARNNRDAMKRDFGLEVTGPATTKTAAAAAASSASSSSA